MGKSLLLLLTAFILGGTVLSLGQLQMSQRTDDSHRENAAEAYAREVADAGRHAILADALDDGEFKPGIAMPAAGTVYAYGGGKYELLNYTTQRDDHVAIFTIRGSFPFRVDSLGDLEYTHHTVTSTYEWSEPCFPGPLMLNSPAPVLAKANGSSISTESTCGGDPATGHIYFDAAQHSAYRMEDMENGALSLGTFQSGLTDSLGTMTMTGSGGLAMMGVDNENWAGGPTPSANSVYEEHTAPQPRAIMGKVRSMVGDSEKEIPGIAPTLNIDALLALGVVPTDLRFEGSQTLGAMTSPPATELIFGTWAQAGSAAGPGSARIAYFEDALTIEEGFTLSGTGILLVGGDLTIDGTLNWDGLVLVYSDNDLLVVEAGENAEVNIRGSLLVEHVAPPPGGHMDFTVWRATDGTWADWRGDGTSGSRKNLRHMHRFGNKSGGWHTGSNWTGCGDDEICPVRSRPAGGDSDARLVTFRDPDKGINSNSAVHEKHTVFHNTMKELDDTEVYLVFNDPEAREDFNGLSTVSVTLPVGGSDVSCTATPVDFGACSQAGALNKHKSSVFEAKKIKRLEVEVASLRLLRRMINKDPIHFPASEPVACPTALSSELFVNGDGACASNNHPGTMGVFEQRQGALRLQVRQASNDALLYEAAMYWHTKEPGHSEYDDELQADQDFYAAVVDGEAYGARLDMGNALTLSFDAPRIGDIVERLGFDAPGVAHTGSTVRRLNVEAGF